MTSSATTPHQRTKKKNTYIFLNRKILNLFAESFQNYGEAGKENANMMVKLIFFRNPMDKLCTKSNEKGLYGKEKANMR